MLASAREQQATSDATRRRRRAWSAEEKHRIVAESLEPGASVSVVVRRHDLNSNLLDAYAEYGDPYDGRRKSRAADASDVLAQVRRAGRHRQGRNNAAERALRGVAIGRRAWLFSGNNRGGERAAAMYSLIVTAKLNDIDPQAWLADVLRWINDHPALRLAELLPWNWKGRPAKLAA
jgi:transposase-like protein